MAEESKTPFISVVLCTYNPRPDYFQRCVDGLKAQTLAQSAWELVVVDNNSKPALAGDRSQSSGASEDKTHIDLSWHPDARIVVETQQGLSHARRRGFAEAKGDLIVNLDDDAVLDPDYLERVIKLADQFPFIGAFGCQIRPEFEMKPDWPVEEYYGAQRVVDRALWTNDPRHHESNPWGVGSVVRKEVAEAYIAKLAADERFAMIGRTASKLLACEDDDIAMTACDVGLGKGVFPELALTHLIPEKRMTDEFQCRNAFGHGYSGTLLEFLRFQRLPQRGVVARLNRFYRILRMESWRRATERAKDRGVDEALKDISKWGWR
jgi:glycosyltransferase involved in cell wall biosynthesis